MSPARTLSANKKTKNKPAEKGKTTPKRLVEKELSDGQSSAKSNDTKILDTWNGLKIVKVVNHIKPKECWEISYYRDHWIIFNSFNFIMFRYK